MTKFILKRLAIFPVSLLVVLTVSFLMAALIPGDPASSVLGDFATPESLARVRAELHLDQPLITRYGIYLTDIVQGDFGRSFFTSYPVIQSIGQRLPNTVELILPSLLLAILLGLALGIVGGYYRDRPQGTASSFVVTLIQSIPDFVLALFLIVVLFTQLRWVPAPVGRLDMIAIPPKPITYFPIIDSILTGKWKVLGSLLAHLVLPVLTLGIAVSAYFAKVVKGAVGDALQTPQAEFARAMGLSEWKIIYYALLTVRTPIITYIAIMFGTLMGGAPIIENIFGWRGLGQWVLEAMQKIDVPEIQGFMVIAGISTLFTYLVLDILVSLLDPRISRG
jgi:ABC-type dipeptide/oligopeptide/nickel transport system permease component